jgi:hypothetical protein
MGSTSAAIPAQGGEEDEQPWGTAPPVSFVQEHMGKGFALVGAGCIFAGFKFGMSKAATFAEDDGKINKMLEKAGAPRPGGASAPSSSSSDWKRPKSSSSSTDFKRARFNPTANPVNPSQVAMRALGAGTVLCVCGAGAVLLALSGVTGIRTIPQLSEKLAAAIPGAHKRAVESLGIKLTPVETMTEEEENAYIDSFLYEGGDGNVVGRSGGGGGGGSSSSSSSSSASSVAGAGTGAGVGAGAGVGTGVVVRALGEGAADAATGEEGDKSQGSDGHIVFGKVMGMKKKKYSALDEAKAWWGSQFA